jgi:preprotein translocase subunit Sec61beta
MSKRKKRKSDRSAPMPAASAGLLRFFEEETQGLRIRPELVVVLSVGLILATILAHLYAQGGLPFL